MAEETHSRTILKESLVDFVDSEVTSTDGSVESPNRAVMFIYGAITPCRMEDFRTQIGDRELSYDEVGNVVKQLSERKGREYSYGVIETERGNSKEYKAIMVIGREIPALMNSGPQSADSLVKGQKLGSVVAEGEQIIEDLKSIGFKDITKEDLFLHASSYLH